MMKKVAAIAVAGGLALAFGAPPALAQGVIGPGQAKEIIISNYGDVGSPSTQSGYVETLGGAISGGYYGNTSNSGANTEDALARGHGVNPSSSPGPTVGGCDAVAGASLGYAITRKGPVAVPLGNIPDRC